MSMSDRIYLVLLLNFGPIFSIKFEIKNAFFRVFIVFCYFFIFLKFYQHMGQKLGSNKEDGGGGDL